MKHAQLVARAADWLRHRYGCGIVLSEQYCATGEVPDVIAWKGHCKSVLVECKASRADFLADAGKPFRQKPEYGMGSQRFYMAPAGIIRADELPKHWGLLELCGREVRTAKKPVPAIPKSSGWPVECSDCGVMFVTGVPSCTPVLI